MAWNSPSQIVATLAWTGPQVTVTGLQPDVPGSPESIVQKVMWNSEDITATRRTSNTTLPFNKLSVTLMCVGLSNYGEIEIYYNFPPAPSISQGALQATLL
jgi:hypothetical protein